jgi:glycerol-3-phosphate dehydrogenase
VVERHFDRRIRPEDVVRTYSGVRPLFDDDASANPSAVTRDYKLDLSDQAAAAPVLNIFGGKITTYRRLAEQALDKLAGYFANAGGPWTEAAPLPGGDIAAGDFDRFLAQAGKKWSWLPRETVLRLARAYGTRMDAVLGEARGVNDLGPCFGADLFQRELEYLAEYEWARSAEDVLWRRSKLGLRVDAGSPKRIDDWFAQNDWASSGAVSSAIRA